MSLRFAVLAVALATAGATSARAASDDELKEIKRQIQELKSSYEARIEALEKRLKEAEARTAPPLAAAPSPVAAAPATTSAASAFNPAISAVLQGRYAKLSQDPSSFAIAGFTPRGEVGPGPRGFSLAESEITLSANVDQKFAGVLTFALTPEDTVSVEEAYGVMIAPLHGVTPKFGRFLSSIGYLNEQHAHAWDFVDAPLAYQAFLGGQFKNDGVQVKWLAPTEHYIELGAEAGSATGFTAMESNRNGAALGTVFAHTGGDIGLSHNWRAGISYLQARGDAGAPDTKLTVADFVWKWAPNGNPREQNFKVQGEYFTQSVGDWKPKGAYVQGVYQFMPEWRFGARYDWLDPAGGTPISDVVFAPDPVNYRSKRGTVMLDWSPSEFSRVRLQFARSQTQPEITDNQFFIQYILSLGAHGAHKY